MEQTQPSPTIDDVLTVISAAEHLLSVHDSDDGDALHTIHTIGTTVACVFVLLDRLPSDVTAGFGEFSSCTFANTITKSAILGDLNDMADFIHEVLPNWWWRIGLCGLSGDISIGPDYNRITDPTEAEAFKRAWPVQQFNAGVHCNTRPGNRASCWISFLRCILDVIKMPNTYRS